MHVWIARLVKTTLTRKSWVYRCNKSIQTVLFYVLNICAILLNYFKPKLFIVKPLMKTVLLIKMPKKLYIIYLTVPLKTRLTPFLKCVTLMNIIWELREFSQHNFFYSWLSKKPWEAIRNAKALNTSPNQRTSLAMEVARNVFRFGWIHVYFVNKPTRTSRWAIKQLIG